MLNGKETKAVTECSCDATANNTSPFHFLFNKWTALVGSMWVLTSTGIMYDFSLYSSELKDVLNYSQSQINLVGTMSDTGGSLGLAAGILSLILPPWAMLLCGGFLNLFGYGTLWLVASGFLPSIPFVMVLATMFIAASSNTFFQTITLMVCVENFPDSRGMVVGLLKGVVGLGGAVYSEIYSAFFSPDQEGFLLLASVAPAVLSVLGTIVIHRYKPKSMAEDSGYLNFFFVVSFGLAGYILVEIIVSTFHTMQQKESQIVAIGLLLILVTPIMVPLSLKSNERQCFMHPEPSSRVSSSANLPAVAQDPESGLQKDENETKVEKVETEVSHRSPLDPPHAGVLESIHSVEFWLLFAMMVAGVGTAFTVTDNLAQIGEAQGYTTTSTATSLINIWNFMGRVLGGFGSEYIIKKYGYPRPILVALCQGLMVPGYLIFAFAIQGSIYFASLIVGFGMGCTFAVVTATASELFGLASFGMIYNLLTCAIPLGSFLFSTMLAGSLYDQQLSIEISLLTFSASSSIVPSVCLGAECYKLTFLVLATVAALGTIASAVLTKRTVFVYNAMYRSQSIVNIGS